MGISNVNIQLCIFRSLTVTGRTFHNDAADLCRTAYLQKGLTMAQVAPSEAAGDPPSSEWIRAAIELPRSIGDVAA